MDRLPVMARRRFEALQEAASIAQSRRDALTAPRAKLDAEHDELRSVLGRLPRDYPLAQRHDLEERFETVQVEISDWEKECKKRMDRVFNDNQVVIHCREFVHLLPLHQELSDFHTLEAFGGKAELANVRYEISAARRLLLELSNAPASGPELKTKIKAFVDDLAGRGTPYIDLRGGGFVADFRNVDMQAPIGLISFMSWLNPEAMTAKLEAEVIKQGIGPALLTAEILALPAAGRKQAAAMLRDKLLAMERNEEALITEMLRVGQDCERRIDADPVAVLSVSIKQRKAAAA